MAMIDPSVTRAVGEVLESHGAKPDPSEPLAGTVARAIGTALVKVAR